MKPLNPTPTPSASVNIDGKDFPVYFGMLAMAEYEELTGISLNELASINNGSGIKNTITLVYIGLKHGAKRNCNEFDFTLESISYIIDDNGLDIVNEITEIFIKQVTRISGVEEETSKKKGGRKAAKRSPVKSK